MTYFAPRTCTEVGEDGSPVGGERPSEQPSRPLEDFRQGHAYVLLGGPGAGKTSAFRHEAEDTGGTYVTARDFTTFDDRPEWHEGTLFIDALDEMRAGSSDGRTPFDSIRAKLDRLGRPRFRLSCREADWFGANDRNHLKEVSKDGAVRVFRLDPLSEDDIRKILLQLDTGVEDADAFIATARERGVETLLANPQSLLMLAGAVTAGEWPETRTETFDLACGKLVREYNPEHQLANRWPAISEPALLDAAGRLCAVQLLTGRAGYALYGDGGDSEYLGLQRISGGDQETLRHVLGTGLFESLEESRMAPVHRQVAEFLAGRYLARLIDEKGLPVGRVLALMTGHDGAVVSDLRGLSAWLAAHCKTSRKTIIERDPLGTVLYGDARGFSPDEKRHLLGCLGRETKRNPWLGGIIKTDPRLGDIATPDMVDFFCRILTDPARDDARRSFVLILLESLTQGTAIPELASLLVEVVRDNQWGPIVKRVALDAFIRHCNGAASELTALLMDINDGSVSDPDDDLLGSLLSALYPTYLSAPEVLRYFRMPRSSSYYGKYYDFWTGVLPEKSTPSQLADLLDGYAASYDRFSAEIQTDPLSISLIDQAPIYWLARFLETSHEEPDPRRLLKWLGVVDVDKWLEVDSSGFELANPINSWIRHHPEILKSMIATGIERCVDSHNFEDCVTELEQCLPEHNGRPTDFGRWCLEKAIVATHPAVRDYFIRKVALYVFFRSHDEGLSREIVEKRCASDTILLTKFIERLSRIEASDNLNEQRLGRLEEQRKLQSLQRRREWQDSVRPQAEALRENRCSLALLDTLAEAYHGSFIGMEGDAPRERLENLLGDDTDLIDAVMEGLRRSIERDDVPDDAEIIRLGAKNMRHRLALPFLAGLEEIFRSAPADAWPLNEKQGRQALAFDYFTLRRHRDVPAWHSLLTSRPDVVAASLTRIIRSELRHGKAPWQAFNEWTQIVRHREVARRAALPLLKTFPVRCTEELLSGLRYLLKAALLHCENAPFQELIERKLTHHSMNVAQRIYWLAAGLLVSPGSYIEELETCIAGRERRVRRLAEVIAEREGFLKAHIQSLDAPVLELLIRLIGASYQPYDPPAQTRWVTSLQVSEFIEQLVSIPSPAATDALERLSSNEDLRSWQSRLMDAAYRQSAVRREAEFRHCTIEQAVQTLDNLKPANAADLAALTTEHLREIATNIRDGNTSDWRQYWNVDRHNRPQEPKPEDGCRDALLSDLRHRLTPLDIDAQPEGRYADDKRSDIRVSFGGFNVPVEIKRSSHRDLWRAVGNQLIPRYTRDPGAGGYGIYLVFWFGRDHCRTPESGRRPRDAAELEDRLCKTLSPDEARKISICVVDVSPPPPSGAEAHGTEAERNGA